MIGLFTLKIGDGTTTGLGTLSSFSEIDWGTTQFFLNVQMKVDASFIGFTTGLTNTGNNNTFVGSYAGENNVLGENNVFIGYGA